MEDQQANTVKDMEETRSALTEKLEMLETKVADKAAPVAQAVERATQATADIVADVKDTIHEVAERVKDVTETVQRVTEKMTEKVQDVTESVQETVRSVSSSFNFKAQVERHPWMVVGVAATAGCLVGNLLGRTSTPSSSTPLPAATPSPSHAKHRREGNGWARRQESSRPEGLFTEELRKVKGLAIGAVLGMLRDLARSGIPGTLGAKIAEEIDSLTTRLGAEPMHEPIIASSSGSQQDVKGEDESRASSGHSFREGNGSNRIRSES